MSFQIRNDDERAFGRIREHRAAAVVRAEAQQARSAEFARTSLEKFECLPQRLAKIVRLRSFRLRDSTEEAANLERLTLERERIGPVNLVAEQELEELETARSKGAEDAEELTRAIHRLRGSIGNLNREGRVRLLDAYEKVDFHFRRLFTTLFEGGQAISNGSKATTRSKLALRSWLSRRESAFPPSLFFREASRR